MDEALEALPQVGLVLVLQTALGELMGVLLRGKGLYHLHHPAVELSLTHRATPCLTALAVVLLLVDADSLEDLSLGGVLCDLVAG